MRHQDRSIRTFLRRVAGGQSLNLAVWAAELLAQKQISDADYAKAQRLGFQAPKGTWTTSYDRQGRQIKMFVPED